VVFSRLIEGNIVRILLVDDHLLFSRGLQFLLADLDASATCTIVNSIAQAVVQEPAFDLILLDYALPDSQSNQGLKRVLAAHEGVPVVMLSGETRLSLVSDLVELGASGFISKASDTEELLRALRTVLDGGIYLPRQILGVPSPGYAGPLDLSPRQIDVLLKVMQGKTNKIIAKELELAENTVKTHITAAFRALNVNTRTEAVFKAAKLGLMPAKDPIVL
jgi:DNA-binding NarL/FixJ family response regulator